MSICPICGGNECVYNDQSTEWPSEHGYHKSTEISCKNIPINFLFHDSVIEPGIDGVERNKRFNMICYIVLNNPLPADLFGNPQKYKILYDKFITDQTLIPYVNLADRMKDYPKDAFEKMEKSFINLAAIHNNVGESFINSPHHAILMFSNSRGSSASNEIIGIFHLLEELNYIRNFKSHYEISGKGWEYIHQLQIDKKVLNQCFIAMAFREETKEIGDIFKSIIDEKCGYVACRIDEKQHNNQIVPEILFEISRSKFVVVDITVPNYGAYYEAGYAEALGKQVIFCCRAKEYNGDAKPHFDIAQKNTIIWFDETDLKEKLYRRIEATVGLNK